jgi:hypothetical protein
LKVDLLCSRHFIGRFGRIKFPPAVTCSPFSIINSINHSLLQIDHPITLRRQANKNETLKDNRLRMHSEFLGAFNISVFDVKKKGIDNPKMEIS